jgi:hypothetical protein
MFAIRVSAQNQTETYEYAIGTSLPSVSRHANVYPRLSLHGGYIKNYFKPDSNLKNRRINTVKYRTIFSISLEQFGEDTIYKFVQNDDYIEYLRISINADVEYNIMEFNWPKNTSVFVQSGVTVVPFLFANNHIANEQIWKSLETRWFNLSYGLGFKSNISDNQSIVVHYKKFLLSDFSTRFEMKDLPRMILDGEPTLNILMISYRVGL